MSELALKLIDENKKTKAKALDLGNCGLTELPDELFELPWLEELVLCSEYWVVDIEKKERKRIESNNKSKANQLNKLSPKLSDLKALKKLYLNDQKELSDLSSLSGLTNLQDFSCISTQVSDLSPLSGLINLQQLRCNITQVSDLSPLSGLINLQQLSCHSTQVSDLSPLSGLINLQQLRCDFTQVSDLSPLSGLRNLQHLFCSSTQVSDLSSLSGLTNLQELWCHSMQVNDLSPLSGLRNLQHLLCSSTQVSDLSPLSGLINLQQLSCHSTQVSDLSPLSGLTNLQELYINKTKIKDLQPLAQLKNLNRLTIDETDIEDIEPLAGLFALEELNISFTQIKDLRPILHLIQKGIPLIYGDWGFINGIYAKDCPLDKSLIAAIKKGSKAVLRYFDKPKTRLFEARVLLLGEPRAGKTTLRRKLKNTNEPMPTVLESTKAFEIEIDPYKCKIEKDNELHNMTYHLWDFGGQDYYRLLHQLFVAEQSAYVIVTDTDRNKNEEEIDFWLDTIQRLGKDKNDGYGPVLLLQNPKTNREGNDFPDLKKRYPFWKQSERFVINLNALAENTETYDRKELDKFKRFKIQLENSFCQLNHIGKEIPDQWVQIRKALMKLEHKNWISIEQFKEVCKSKQITDETEQEDLLGIFHTLGYVLHYKNTMLRSTVILKKEWVTDALYRVLDDAIVRENRGWFRQSDAELIWHEAQYKNQTHQLLALMEEFKLSYYNRVANKHIVPAKLPEDTEGLPEWDSSNNVHLHLQYDWMPRVIPIQLIVSLHDNLVTLENGEQWIWRKGAVLDGRQLDLKDVQVQVIENFRQNRIEITARGTNSEVLIRTVMKHWREVNQPFEDKLTVRKTILCACDKCQTAATPFSFEYEDVLNAVEAKVPLQCNKSLKPFSATEILKGVFDASTVTVDLYGAKGHRLNEELKNLISDGQLDKALDLLSDDEYTLALKRQFADLKSAYLKGTLSFSEYDIQASRIVSNLLEYLNEDWLRKTGRMSAFGMFNLSGFEDKKHITPSIPSIHIHIENKPQFHQIATIPIDFSELKAILAQLTDVQKENLKTFVETLPEPESQEEKTSLGKQILKWLDKNSEAIAGNVAASVYYDGLKALLGL